MIEREFAGRMRSFALVNDHSAPGLIYEVDGMTLPDLGQKAARARLSATEVRHVLVHALCHGHMRNLIAAQDLVDEEMRLQPYFAFVPLVTEVIEAALAGVQQPS